MIGFGDVSSIARYQLFSIKMYSTESSLLMEFC